jgi:hypothetical protein
MESIEGIQPGNLFEYYTMGSDTEFVNGNEELKNSFEANGIRTYIGVLKADSIEPEKINGMPIENFEPIFLNDEWLKRLKAKSFGQNNFQIGKLHFKIPSDFRVLILCDENFTPIPNERLVSFVHHLQNLHKDKTGEELRLN